MKVFQDLRIRGAPQTVESFVQSVMKSLPSGWRCDESSAGEITGIDGRRRWCFSCAESQGHPEADLWLVQRDTGEIVLGNIVSGKVPQLSRDQYNTILNEFHESCLQANKPPVVSIEASKADVDLEDFLSSETSRRLKSFSKMANRSVLHWCDTERWRKFLITAHFEEWRMPPDILHRWLAEEEGWPDDRALDLVIQYEQARDLLQDYDEACRTNTRPDGS